MSLIMLPVDEKVCERAGLSSNQHPDETESGLKSNLVAANGVKKHGYCKEKKTRYLEMKLGFDIQSLTHQSKQLFIDHWNLLKPPKLLPHTVPHMVCLQ